MSTFYYFRDLAREFNRDALKQIREHALRHRNMAADSTQREGKAKAALRDLADAIQRVEELAETEDLLL